MSRTIAILITEKVLHTDFELRIAYSLYIESTDAVDQAILNIFLLILISKCLNVYVS